MIYAAAFKQLTLLPRGPTVHLQPPLSFFLFSFARLSPAGYESPQAGCLPSRAATIQMDPKLNFTFNTSNRSAKILTAPGGIRLARSNLLQVSKFTCDDSLMALVGISLPTKWLLREIFRN